MLTPADRLLELLREEITRLGGDPNAEVSAAQATAVALALLQKRERDGPGAVKAQMRNLAALLDSISAEHARGLAVGERVVALRARLDRDQNSDNVVELEERWRAILIELEGISIALQAQIPDKQARARLTKAIADWEIQDRSREAAFEPPLPDRLHNVTRDSLEHYLQHRFAEAGMRVTGFTALPGGFGKQTYLFDVAGDALSGAYVMRRDFPYALAPNDCHHVSKEFEVIRAVYARGFPGPEAVWLDTDHDELPGGDFLVMRRSPGVAGGSVIKAKTKVPEDLAAVLAGIVARLHALDFMEELSHLTESLNIERWNMPLGDCVRAYIESWPKALEVVEHEPSSAVATQLVWLLDNMPKFQGRPVLVQGDIGFHNLLFDNGKTTAVLDWEFTHVGDPAEDLAGIRNTLGESLDWPAFLEAYRAAGGAEVSPDRIHYFQVWNHVRNALVSVTAATTFLKYQDDIKFVLTPNIYVPHFLRSAQALIEAGPQSEG